MGGWRTATLKKADLQGDGGAETRSGASWTRTLTSRWHASSARRVQGPPASPCAHRWMDEPGTNTRPVLFAFSLHSTTP